eukprot:CAMPEP_0195633980 /NCGR_PEP_ID=MMETSP0815-20121206/22446_1 /TAXON_ID=97485 /ORGANISM="Prymnesium parvum, Strain Texoma1" /LENGTH=109 /DNA_ID=CAMNT_0040775701 /DNA_START=128 /DNA_END=454 /DNA_ORIENTATION=+
MALPPPVQALVRHSCSLSACRLAPPERDERREREGRDPHSPLEDVEDHQQEEREGEHEKDLVRELAPLQLAQRSLPHADAAPDASLLQHGVLERLPLRVQRAQRALRPL